MFAACLDKVFKKLECDNARVNIYGQYCNNLVATNDLLLLSLRKTHQAENQALKMNNNGDM